MKTSAQKKQTNLFEIAKNQLGYFTSKQAESVGYLPTNSTYHVQSGNWIKEGRGIYRLRNFPQSNDAHYAFLSLWSRNRNDIPQGIFSHETALSLFEISDLNPTKVHMTVPKSFRRSAKTPKGVELHFNDLKEHHIETKHGYRVTKPIKTIVDLFTENSVSSEHIETAFQDGINHGLITIAETHSSELPIELRELFKQWLRDNKRLKKVKTKNRETHGKRI